MRPMDEPRVGAPIAVKYPSPRYHRIQASAVCALLVATLAACSGSNETPDPFALCGDGVIEPGEQCDPPSLPTPQPGATGTPVPNDTGECLTTCQLNVCGDGFVWVGVEECDTFNLNGQECSSLSPPLEDGTLTCTSDCTFDTSQCGPALPSTPTPPPTVTPTATPPPGRVTVNLGQPPSGSPIRVVVLLAYPTDKVSLPTPPAGSVTPLQGTISFPPNPGTDLKVQVVNQAGLNAGGLFRVQFEIIGGAELKPEDFACTVDTCNGAQGCTCSVTVP
jgi:hypothetical protein